LGNGTIATPPTIVVSSTTPAQYVSAGGGATNATQATFNFISSSGSATITEMKFTVSGSDASPSQTVTNVCVGSVCAQPVAGVADLTGLQLAVPLGGGLVQSALVSYSSVGTGGITPNTNTVVSLTYVKYTSGGTTANFSPAVAANTITLVGSKPTVVVAAGGSGGYALNTSVKVGQVTVTADAKGAIKVQKITFNIGYSGFSASPTSTSAEFISLGGGSTAIPGSSCAPTSSATVETCTLGTSYATDFLIGAGQSQQFDLYLTNNTGTIGTTVATVTSTPTAAGFVWDDTSTNGGAYSTGFTGTLLYGFPTNAYKVTQ